MPEALVARLRLEAAVEAEISSRRQTLIPSISAWGRLGREPNEFAAWLSGRLRAGFAPSAQVVVPTRKPGHGIRPVPIWGVAERITYRALTDLVLAGRPPIDRSSSAYAKFLKAPLDFALELSSSEQRPELTPGNSALKYVVKSDITAFYQYIDHEVLANELLLQTGEYDAIQLLMQLLGQTQGRRYGLPQAIDSSDRLSELYIDIAQRSLIRRGIPVWRYNDDFRIACKSYSEALRSIELLDEAARDIGLVLSDCKTTTPKFSRYVRDNTNIAVDDLLMQEEGEPIEDVLNEYDEAGPMEPGAALAAITRVKIVDRPRRFGGIDIRSLNIEQNKLLRRAWSGLAHAADPRAASDASRFFSFTPALTPNVSRYLLSLVEEAPDACAEAVDEIRNQVSLADWQRCWLAHVIRIGGLLQDGSPGDVEGRVDWVRKLRYERSSPFLMALATVALAESHRIDLDDVEFATRGAPEVLLPWFMSAARALSSETDTARVRALALTHPMGVWLVE